MTISYRRSLFAFVCHILRYYSVRVDVFFLKQKTAYEMRISDWSSDVCSSDLGRRSPGRSAMPKGSKTTARIAPLYVRSVEYCAPFPEHRVKAGRRLGAPATPSRHPGEIAYSADSSPGLRPFT